MKKIYIVSAKRTAIGSFNGTLSTVPAAQLGADVVKVMLADTGMPPESIVEVATGNVLPAGFGQNPSRQVSIGAGIPAGVPAYTVNMVCGSGMKAVTNAMAAIQSGQNGVYLAGGTENMSLAPYLLPGARQGLRMGNKELVDHMVYDALTDVFGQYHMGITAENVAEQFGITREEQDTFAIHSQEKAIAAVDAGAFKDETVPVTVKMRKEEVVFDTDEYPNRKTSLEKLGTLRAAFKKDGTVTAGNASGINDGAAFVMLADEDSVQRHALVPMAELVAWGQGGVDPAVMGLGPVPAIRQVLQAAQLKLGDMDILELNEAFAAQSLGVVGELSREHGVAKDELLARTNLNGGAIALGHPVGASGARIVVTLAHLMQKRDVRYGLASLCIGGGMGIAVILRSV